MEAGSKKPKKRWAITPPIGAEGPGLVIDQVSPESPPAQAAVAEHLDQFFLPQPVDIVASLFVLAGDAQLDRQARQRRVRGLGYHHRPARHARHFAHPPISILQMVQAIVYKGEVHCAGAEWQIFRIAYDQIPSQAIPTRAFAGSQHGIEREIERDYVPAGARHHLQFHPRPAAHNQGLFLPLASSSGVAVEHLPGSANLEVQQILHRPGITSRPTDLFFGVDRLTIESDLFLSLSKPIHFLLMRHLRTLTFHYFSYSAALAHTRDTARVAHTPIPRKRFC